MPGMMDTILNLGLNDLSVEGLARKTGNERFAWDCYRRFIQMFASVVMDFEKNQFEHLIEALKHKRKVKLDTELTADDLKSLVLDFKRFVRRTPAATSRRIRSSSSRSRVTPCSARGRTIARSTTAARTASPTTSARP